MIIYQKIFKNDLRVITHYELCLFGKIVSRIGTILIVFVTYEIYVCELKNTLEKFKLIFK